MRDFEQAYNQQGSQRFSPGGGAAQRGTYSRFLESAGSGLGTAAGQMGSGFSVPRGTNAQEQSALADSLESTAVGQFGSGLDQMQGQFSALGQIGGMGLSSIQSAQAAKEMAQLRGKSARQGTAFTALNTGLSALGSIYGGIRSRQASTGESSTGKLYDNVYNQNQLRY